MVDPQESKASEVSGSQPASSTPQMEPPFELIRDGLLKGKVIPLLGQVPLW